MAKLIYNGQEIADVTYTSGEVEPTSNLWGGLRMAIDFVKALASTAAADYINIVASWSVHEVVVNDSIFEANTQYTAILTYENSASGTIQTNLAFKYSDGTYDVFNITGSQNTKYTRAFVSAAGKTVVAVTGYYANGTSKIYYNESGIFEGVKTVEDFEPYNRYNE